MTTRLAHPKLPDYPGDALPQGRSRALFSSWLWWRPWRLLIDAGDGVADTLEDESAAIRTVALTHLHTDHCLGLPALLAGRQPGSLQTGGDLTVLLPKGDVRLPHLLQWIDALGIARRGPTDPVLTLKEIEAGESHVMDATRTIRAFAVDHAPGRPCLGYVVTEPRQQLRAEWQGKPGDVIRDARATLGDAAVMEMRQHPRLVHTGDAAGLPDRTGLSGADLLVADATFRSAEDRESPSHWTLDETLEVAADLRPKALMLQHLSRRYPRRTLVADLEQDLRDRGWTMPTWLLDDRQLVALKP